MDENKPKTAFGSMEWDMEVRFNEVRDILMSEKNVCSIKRAESARIAIGRLSGRLSDFAIYMQIVMCDLEKALEKYSRDNKTEIEIVEGEQNGND